MSISVADNFQYKGGKPLDARMKFATILDMTAAPVADLYDGCFSYVVAEQKYYSYDSNNENDPHLGKWREYSAGAEYSDFTGATSQDAGAHGLVPAPTTGDISKFLKGDGTWATVPMPSFDYSNTSPEAMNFSTDEKVIGTWIDGKPLYQKTVNFTLPASNVKIDTGISGVDFVGYVSAGSTLFNGNDETVPLDTAWYSNKGTTFMFHRNNGGSLQLRFLVIDDWIGSSGKITIRYTKTTDTPVASGEKIVGQWIDGKPVFEKTLSINTPTSTTEESHSIGASIDKAISINATIITPYGTNYCGSIYAINSFEKGIKFFVETNSNLSNPNSLSVYVSQDSWMDLPCYVTVRYTKTT